MILTLEIDGQKVAIAATEISSAAEQAGSTLITLSNGQIFQVQESPEEVERRRLLELKETST